MSFKQHLRAVPWLDKLVDLLVVILGISIAFGINNWADSRKNERLEQTYLCVLQADLSKDSIQMIEIIDNIDSLTSSIKVMNSLYGDIENADSIGYHLTNLGRERFFSAEDYTYRSLQQSGSFHLIRDDSLRLSLSKLHDIYEQCEEQEELAYEMSFRYIVGFLENYNGKVAINPALFNQPRFSFGINVYYNNLYQRKKVLEDALTMLRKTKGLINESLE